MKRSLVFFAAVAGLFAVTAAFAAGDKLKAHPEEYNPDNAPVTITAEWRTFSGLPDPSGKSDSGLILGLSSDVEFPPGASADATIKTLTPKTVLTLDAGTPLAFDHKIGTLCSGGAPRWNVETADGGVYAYQCSNGTPTPIPGFPDWERRTFDCADTEILATASSGSPCPFGSGQQVTFLQVLVDIEGETTLDNLRVNNCIMGKPGNCK